MASRTFTDDRGVQWVVLAVSPAWAERRARKERRVKDIGPKPGQPDRRKGGDRRRGLPERGPRTKIDPSLAGGWLVFEGAGERRRLSPAPSEWRDATEAELRQMLKQAKVVFNPRGRLIE